ncbi:MAG: c-type cytochrome domain-containing protein, partial [Rhodospirillales bacterium]|nr:c-type cytochrome domain-containing protein [Rhodospirillales bacterium]
RTYCLDCHEPGGAGYEESGLDLRTYEGLMKGTKFGPVVTPGDAFTSNLMVLIEGRAAKEIRMPHRSYQQGPSKSDRKLLRAWINVGAKDSAIFRDQVYPILELYCLECHLPGGKGYEESGLDMRDYENLMKGTMFGPIIVPGDAFTSNIMVLLEGRSKFGLKMPFAEERNLSKWEKHLVRAWINRGALNN